MAPVGFVKGGTTSAREDERVAMVHADAERRRNIEAARFQKAKAHSPRNLKSLQETGESANISQLQLGGRSSHASVVLGLKHPKDGQVLDWITCELSLQGNPTDPDAEMLLIVCCPRCVTTMGRHPEESQLTIRQSNRMFHVDQRTRANRKPNEVLGFCAGDTWVNPQDPTEVYTIAGMVTTEGWCRCPHLGCTWKFRIDDSVVYTE